MVKKNKAKFLAKLDQLYPMLEWVRPQLLANELDAKAIHRVELALEEVIVNIIRHGYQETPGEIELQFKCVAKKRVEISIRDQGPPFNPLEYSSEIDRDAPLEERQEGGLGIFFLLKCMDEIRYDRANESNVLTLVKNLTHSSQTS